MLNKIIATAATAALAALLTPSQAGAYGAAHVGYTHVGPNGVYHEGATEFKGERNYKPLPASGLMGPVRIVPRRKASSSMRNPE